MSVDISISNPGFVFDDLRSNLDSKIIYYISFLRISYRLKNKKAAKNSLLYLKFNVEI